MAPQRKARTAKLSRAGALYRARESTRLEGGSLSAQQQVMIEQYQAGTLTSQQLRADAVTRAERRA